jgi:RNA polymerase sigma factor (sigma-70 family)
MLRLIFTMQSVGGDTELGRPSPAFPETSSTRIRMAQSGDPVARAHALGDLVEGYWSPVYHLIRHGWGRSREEAKDLTQDFFVRTFLDRSAIDSYLLRGQFRSYIKSAVRNFMSDVRDTDRAVKRGSAARFWAIDSADRNLEELVPDPRGLTPEEVFDSAWRRLVIDRAIELLQRRLELRGKGRTFEVFRRYDLAQERERPSYHELGASVGLGPDAVKVNLLRARREFRAALSDIVWEYAGSGTAEEIRDLFAL